MSLWNIYVRHYWSEGRYLFLNRGPIMWDIVLLTFALTGVFAYFVFRKPGNLSWSKPDTVPAETKLQKWNILLCHFLSTALWLFVLFWLLRGFYLLAGSMGSSMAGEVSREYGPGLSRGPFYAVVIMFAYICNFFGLLLGLYAPVGSASFRMLLLERPLIILSSDKPVYKIPWNFRWWLGYVIPGGILVWLLMPVLKGALPVGILYYGPVVLYMWSNWGLGHDLAKRKLVRNCLRTAFYWFFIYSFVNLSTLLI